MDPGELADSYTLGLRTGSRAVRTVAVVSAQGGRGQDMNGTEQERQQGHRKSLAFGVKFQGCRFLCLLCDLGEIT